MRITIFLFLLACSPIFLLGQNGELQMDAKKVSQEWSTTYQLDQTQQQKMLKVQEDYFSKLIELEALKTSNYDLYLVKRQGLRKMRMDATYAMLSKKQKEIYKSVKLEREEKVSQFKAQLKKSGASVEEIKRALMEME